MNIILTGLPYSGKSTLGSLLAKNRHLPFIDLDKEIEKKLKLSTSEIYRIEGEMAFRHYEKKVLSELNLKTSTVISLGGGTLELLDSYLEVKKLGYIIYLRCFYEIALKRMGQVTPAYLNENKKENSFKALAEKREVHYLRRSNGVVDVSNLNRDQAVEEIEAFLKESGNNGK